VRSSREGDDARAQSSSLSRFGGIATVVPASDYVLTFRGEKGLSPDLVALGVADHVLTFRGDELGNLRSRLAYRSTLI
jgi:hypothetical protein